MTLQEQIASRGMNLGRIYTQDGILVATVAQENLMRVLD